MKLKNNPFSRVLAIETSSLKGSIAVACDGIVISEISWHRKQSHGELIIARIEQALKWAEISAHDIDCVAVDIGPGSFTGIRVGINAAKTFAYSLQIPVRCFNSLEIMAATIPSTFKKSILAVVNAHDGHFFVGRFSAEKKAWKLAAKVAAVPYEKIEAQLAKTPFYISEDAEGVAKFCSPKLRKRITHVVDWNLFPSASILAQLAVSSQKPSRTLDWKTVAPLYIRASAPEEKMKKLSVRGRGVHGSTNRPTRR